MSHYDVLEVHPAASPEVIRAAFRALQRRYHPDLGGADPERARAINEAHDVLSDPDRRAAYDRDLARVAESAQTSGEAPADWETEPHADWGTEGAWDAPPPPTSPPPNTSATPPPGPAIPVYDGGAQWRPPAPTWQGGGTRPPGATFSLRAIVAAGGLAGRVLLILWLALSLVPVVASLVTGAPGDALTNLVFGAMGLSVAAAIGVRRIRHRRLTKLYVCFVAVCLVPAALLAASESTRSSALALLALTVPWFLLFVGTTETRARDLWGGRARR